MRQHKRMMPNLLIFFKLALDSIRINYGILCVTFFSNTRINRQCVFRFNKICMVGNGKKNTAEQKNHFKGRMNKNSQKFERAPPLFAWWLQPPPFATMLPHFCKFSLVKQESWSKPWLPPLKPWLHYCCCHYYPLSQLFVVTLAIGGKGTSVL